MLHHKPSLHALHDSLLASIPVATPIALILQSECCVSYSYIGTPTFGNAQSITIAHYERSLRRLHCVKRLSVLLVILLSLRLRDCRTQRLTVLRTVAVIPQCANHCDCAHDSSFRLEFFSGIFKPQLKYATHSYMRSDKG